jgi:glycosyltransferase involved in cell wall biosynthesis
MKAVKNLYRHLTSNFEFKTRYPNYHMADGKIHILFLSACTNESGYYRMILPALELNKTLTHAAIIANIHKWDFNKQFDDYDTPIDFRLIQWADYIVLPTLFTDVSYIIQSIRCTNSDAEFVMDLDVNYHCLPIDHPDSKRYTPLLKDQLVQNLRQIDLLTAPNEQILDTYLRLAEEQEDELSVYFDSYRNLLSHYTFEEITQISRNSTEVVRIGIITDGLQGADMQLIEGALKKVQEKYKLNLEIIVIGWSKKNAEQQQLFQQIAITYELSVPFQEYHARLNSLQLDIALLPLVKNDFNESGKALNRYLDFSACMIPVVASSILPLQTAIEEGETGFLVTAENEWFEKMERLIDDKALRRSVGEHAFKMAWENFSYTPKTIERLQNLFI